MSSRNHATDDCDIISGIEPARGRATMVCATAERSSSVTQVKSGLSLSLDPPKHNRDPESRHVGLHLQHVAAGLVRGWGDVLMAGGD